VGEGGGGGGGVGGGGGGGGGLGGLCLGKQCSGKKITPMLDPVKSFRSLLGGPSVPLILAI